MADGSTLEFPGWTPAFQAALERLTIAVRRPARSQYAGAVRSRIRGRALEFADYRAYTPGDDPKLVDWRAYSRLDRLYLKQYDEERARTLTLLIDASASMDWGEGDVHKGLYARRLAAALSWIALGRLEPVRAYLLRDGFAVPLQPVLARPALVGLLGRLRVEQGSGRAELAAAMRTALSSRSPGPAILLTDLLDPKWADALDALAATGEGTVLQVLAPDEWEPSLGEEVELQDAESGELRPTRLGPVELAAYRERLHAFLADVQVRCRRRGLLHVALNTATPHQEAILRRLPAAGVLR